MSSSNKTSLGLNQWDATDPIQRVDFNKDNDILNAVLEQKADLSKADFAETLKVAGETVWHQGNLPVEMGSWTPVLLGSVVRGNPTYHSALGYYIRQGNLVYIQFILQITDKGGMEGEVQIEGVPLSCRNTGIYHYIGIGNALGLNLTNDFRCTNGLIHFNGVIGLVKRSATTGARLLCSEITDGFNLSQCCGQFITDDPVSRTIKAPAAPSMEDRLRSLEQTNQRILALLEK